MSGAQPIQSSTIIEVDVKALSYLSVSNTFRRSDSQALRKISNWTLIYERSYQVALLASKESLKSSHVCHPINLCGIMNLQTLLKCQQ